MKKISEVLRLHFKLHLSLRQSATLSKISLGTASNHINRFKEINIDIDEFISLNEIEQEKLFYPKNVSEVKSQASKVMPDFIYIHNELKRKKQTKVTLSLLYEEYKEANPTNCYGSTQFRNYYSNFLNKINPSMKQVHLSGEKLFVDNKKDGIVINESYAALARHYNMAVSPARPYKPKDKSKAEQGVQGIQRWILAVLRHQTFFSVDELNDAISLLLDKYNNKIIKRFNKSRTAMFEELDKPFLQPLPNERYIYKEFKEATVSQSYHIFLEGCEYSVPYKYLGFKVFVSYSNQSVAIYYKGIQIALHPKLHFSGQVSTLREHMPTNHQYANEKINPGKFLNWANSIGINTLLWVKKEFKKVSHAPNAYRKLNAVLNLAKIYGKKELDLALEYALDNNITATVSIKSVLDKKLYLQKTANNDVSSLSIVNNHEYLRGNIYQ
jgi:hypothetical protein